MGSFVEPDEVEFFTAFLLLLNLDSPETLYTFCLVCSWSMVVSFMRIDFGDSKSEEREWEELEAVLEGGSVSNLGKLRVLLAGFGVCF